MSSLLKGSLIGHPSIEELLFACGRVETWQKNKMLSSSGKCRPHTSARFEVRICKLARNHVWGVYEWVKVRTRYAHRIEDVYSFCKRHPKLKAFPFKGAYNVPVSWIIK